MKYLTLVVVTLIATTPGWAAEQRFPVKLRGVIESATGKSKITDQQMVTIPGNRLVLMINRESHIVSIEEWDAGLTTKIDRDPLMSGKQGLMENFRMAIVENHKASFMANLEMIDVDWNSDGVQDYDGNLQLVARMGVDRITGRFTRVYAKLIGVLNDPVNGIVGNDNELFHGFLTTTGPSF